MFFGQFFDKICHSGALHCGLHWLLLACVKIARNFLVLHPSFQCTDRHTGLQSCSATITIMQNTVRKYSAIHQFSDTLENTQKNCKKSTNIKITVCVYKNQFAMLVLLLNQSSMHVLVHCKYFNCQNTIFALHQHLRHIIVAQSAKGIQCSDGLKALQFQNQCFLL